MNSLHSSGRPSPLVYSRSVLIFPARLTVYNLQPHPIYTVSGELTPVLNQNILYPVPSFCEQITAVGIQCISCLKDKPTQLDENSSPLSC